MMLTQAGGSILAIPKVKTVLSSRYADRKLGQCIVTGEPLVWLKLGGMLEFVVTCSVRPR